MSIDKIGQVNGYNGYNKINKTNNNRNINSGDSVNISNEALDAAEKKRIFEIVMSAPDVRKDKVEEIKNKLKDPNYINDTILKETTEKILDAFGV